MIIFTRRASVPFATKSTTGWIFTFMRFHLMSLQVVNPFIGFLAFIALMDTEKPKENVERGSNKKRKLTTYCETIECSALMWAFKVFFELKPLEQ